VTRQPTVRKARTGCHQNDHPICAFKVASPAFLDAQPPVQEDGFPSIYPAGPAFFAGFTNNAKLPKA
jgi:hypothetical protein